MQQHTQFMPYVRVGFIRPVFKDQELYREVTTMIHGKLLGQTQVVIGCINLPHGPQHLRHKVHFRGIPKLGSYCCQGIYKS